jgi:uncharacterized membrane protein YGL010W
MKYTIDTKKLKKKLMFENNKHLVLAIVLAVFSAVIFIKLIFPTGLMVFNFLVALVYMWVGLEDVNFKFIGGIFFFLIGWKIFEALCSVLWVILEKYAEEYNLWRTK